MTSIIKNQLVKHLSRFTRNLKPEQISLDVLKGKSKLAYVEINEEILSDILELPAWLRIKRAYCTGVTVSVPWTKLKSAPVQIFIDEIQVEVELATNPSPSDSSKGVPVALNSASSYGFVDKVIEGMSLYINTLEISFDSDAFGGSFMLSRLSVESRTPGWQAAQDLRHTRITCANLHRSLMYKQVSWHLLRIEASAKSDKHEKRSTINAPLRLITSGGRIRIALKKDSNNGSVIHARIQTILEDILWVATLPQLRSAIGFYAYVMSLVQPTANVNISTTNGAHRSSDANASGKIGEPSNNFKVFDFGQTSYHLHVKKIDLHLCDDASSNSNYPPNWNIESGALQVTLTLLVIDIYPHTLASADRTNWLRYVAPNAFTHWMGARLKTNLEHLSQTLDDSARIRLNRCVPQLLSFNVVVRVYDLVVQGVSEMSSKKETLHNVLSSERQARQVPCDQYIVHFEFSKFFHPMSDTLPAPAPCSYFQLGPLSLLFDRPTIRWCLYVVQNLSTAMDYPNLDAKSRSDFRAEIFMTKLTIPLPDTGSDRRLPTRLLSSLSKLCFCNYKPNSEGTSFSFANLTDELINRVRDIDINPGKESCLRDLQQVLQDSVMVEDCEKFWIETSPAWIDTDHGHQTKPLPVLSDIRVIGALLIQPSSVNLYVEPVVGCSVVLDHFQFLQITRFFNSLSVFLDVLSSDKLHYNKANSSSVVAPCLTIVAAVNKICSHIILTMGDLRSPYDVSVTENSLLEVLSDAGRSQSNTPRPSNISVPLIIEERRKTRIVVEEFPEFPTRQNENDSIIDDTLSVATSFEEDSLDFEIQPEEESFLTPDIAEEADAIDEQVLNDRIYKSLMAKHVNALHVSLNSVLAVINVFEGDTRVVGNAEKVDLSYDLNLIRQTVYDDLRKSLSFTSMHNIAVPQVSFCVEAPSSIPTAFVKIQLRNIVANLDDEILTHLGAFALDEETTDNNVRLTVSVEDSNIHILDRKKKKPLRIMIKECTIEQDEDSRDTLED